MQMRICSEEMEALDGLSLLPRCVYLFGIRPHMDYATGMVGIKRGISWQSLAESCYIEHHQGRKDAGTPHKSRIRRAVDELVREGIIEQQTKDRRLVFKCLHAVTDQSEQEKPDRRPTHVRHTQAVTNSDSPETNHGAGLQAEADTNTDTRPTHPEPPKPDTPPESGIRTPPKGGESAARAKRLDTSQLPTDLSKETWQDWLEHRKGIKAPVRSQSIVKTVARELEKAREAGWEPDHALTEAMMAGWRGFEAAWLKNRVSKDNVAHLRTGHKRRSGFSEIDHEAEARAAGFPTEVN